MLHAWFAGYRFRLQSLPRSGTVGTRLEQVPGTTAMSVRSPLKVTVRGKDYAGEYETDGNLVRVFFEERNKTTKLKVSSNPEFVARLLLIELICRI